MDILSILRMIYHCVHPLTLATSHQYKPFVPSKFSRKNPETLSRRGMLLALAARASAYPKSRKIGLMDTAESPATQHKSSSLDHRWSTLGDFLNIFWNPRTQTAIQCQYISKPWNFPIFFGCPNHFLMTCGREWPHGTSAAMSSIQLSGRPAASLAAHAGAIQQGFWGNNLLKQCW